MWSLTERSGIRQKKLTKPLGIYRKLLDIEYLVHIFKTHETAEDGVAWH